MLLIVGSGLCCTQSPPEKSMSLSELGLSSLPMVQNWAVFSRGAQWAALRCSLLKGSENVPESRTLQ